MADIEQDPGPGVDLDMDQSVPPLNSESSRSGHLPFDDSILPVYPDPSKSCVQQWMDIMSKGTLSYNDFKEHWRIWVPKIYSPEPKVNCLEWTFDEEQAKQVLFDPLERFICDGDPAEVLQRLSQMENPPSVCRRVFKMGEPTYSCRECGMDSTCVLCVDCFKQSAHRHHKYKMGTSGGGGCCDCGDTEAWKTEPFCDMHMPDHEEAQDQKRLPEELLERARVLFAAVLKYAYKLLTLEHTPYPPRDLRVKEYEEDRLGLVDTDTYCTVLFNDETHTFDQVITTLGRVIKCSQKDAIEYVTNIDREGRAVVKCSTFQHCTEMRTEIERFTSRHGNRPLKVLVVHAHVVAHQIYAMKLLEWLQKLLGHAEGFRALFSEVALQATPPDASIVEGILLRDTHLWKSARTHWHRLIISGMLMEYESKKAFARVFTKHYGTVVKDFMRDDHDHSFSIASMSVQVFTVPTLAHYLIAHEEVLFVLLNAFLSECSRKCNKSGKLEFERNVPNGTFKRAQYILYDLRYLLSAKPTAWTDELRRGFLQGLAPLLNLLTMMQGMDMVTRQVGQHMEYEPEWESAFNLHIKLAHVITLALEWCGTDRVVLIKAYRATLKKLYENLGSDLSQVGEVRELADHSAACLPYDVATQPVSIHLPLSRFLAGLHLHLEKYDLTFDSQEFAATGCQKPTPEQIIEPVLRTQVMISQVHAGMWRRNGYSLLNQLYFYHNVKCRSEMLDKDVVLLQIGASLIEGNEFLIHLLNKFNLVNWAHPQFETNSLKSSEEDSMRQTISLVEEFLGVLLMIVGERHMPGVGQVSADDRIKKEIVQQLCIKPLPHSELNKTLSEDVNHETGMERVIDQVAEFKKPAHGLGKGVYELKPTLFDEYNVFFYHYTREELSKSEEAQRKRRKQAGELECCPPPPLPPLTDAFMMAANLLQCDVMLHVLRVERNRAEFVVFTDRADKWGLEKLIEELCSSARVEAHKDLLAWTLAKYRKLAAPRRAPGEGAVPAAPAAEAGGDAPAGDAPGASPPTSAVDAGREEKEWRAKMAAQKRAKIMAQMTAMQKNFMKENAKLFEATLSGLGDAGRSRAGDAAPAGAVEGDELRGSSMDLSEGPDSHAVALGPHQSVRAAQQRAHTCILCQEDQAVTADGPALVLAAFVQQSTVLSRVREPGAANAPPPDALFLPAALGPAPHTGTCGHVMHSRCCQKYLDNVLAKESRRPYRMRQPASFDVEKQEFLCPLCECLSNTLLPLVPPLAALQPSPKPAPELALEPWLQGLRVALKYKRRLGRGRSAEPASPTPAAAAGTAGSAAAGAAAVAAAASDASLGSPEPPADEAEPQPQFYTCPIDQVLVEMGDLAGDFAALFPSEGTPDGSPASSQLSENLSEMIQLFSLATYTKGLGVHPHMGDSRVTLMAWKSCAYTIHALENLLRDGGRPLLGGLSSRQQDCLEGLVRLVGVLASTWRHPRVLGSHALQLLSLLLETVPDGPCLFEWDSFGILVPLTLSLPSLFSTDAPPPVPTGDAQDLNVLKLIFAANAVKALLTLDTSSLEEAMDVEDDDKDEEALRPLIDLIRSAHAAAGLTPDLGDLPSARQLWAHVRNASLPFLRCCALFYHFLTGVPAPPALTEAHGDTFENLCSYLDLPVGVTDLLGTSLVQELTRGWCEHPKVKWYLTEGSGSLLRLPAPVNQLVPLPTDYSELINTVSMFTCPNSDREDSRNPTLCLVCDEMLCSQSYCCQTELNKSLVGACTYHAHECGAGVGLFLRVRECEVLLLAAPGRGCFLTPPYLDQYGETDQGLRRGNPLTLCPERYRRLHTLWLSHGVHEEIARALETSSNVMSTQWQHL
ncbi:E3 ubiquitin-protein ligase UBR1 [Gryllus bimaculatus]|nr:E3 ubiquitin-protein ligase UBR1 [Gryllus bimaculatus]